jgi:hypothetical protein
MAFTYIVGLSLSPRYGTIHLVPRFRMSGALDSCFHTPKSCNIMLSKSSGTDVFFPAAHTSGISTLLCFRKHYWQMTIILLFENKIIYYSCSNFMFFYSKYSKCLRRQSNFSPRDHVVWWRYDRKVKLFSRFSWKELKRTLHRWHSAVTKPMAKTEFCFAFKKSCVLFSAQELTIVPDFQIFSFTLYKEMLRTCPEMESRQYLTLIS